MTDALEAGAPRDGRAAPARDPEEPVLQPRRRRQRGWLVHRALLLADLVGLTAAFVLASTVLFPQDAAPDAVALSRELLVFATTLPFWILVAKIYGLYDRDEERTDHTTVEDLVSVFHLVTVGCFLLLGLTLATGAAQPSLARLFVFWALAIVLVTVARAAARGACRRTRLYRQNTVIVGAGEVGQLVAHKLLQHPEYGVHVLGFLDDAPKERRDDLADLTVLGAPRDVTRVVEELDVDRVIVAFSGQSHEETLDLIRSLKDRWVQVDVVPRLYEIVGPGVGLHTVEGLPLINLAPFRLTRSSRVLKRLTDVVLASSALVILAPLLITIAVLVRLTSPGPAFFRQTRMGAGGRTFCILKFRTMSHDADEHKEAVAHLNVHGRNGHPGVMFKIAGDPRTTVLGRVLRRFSLDELPQLLNVLRGEMSLVGPRPLILDEDKHVREWARRRLDLKPGMTGLWQVLGRSGIPFEEMVKLDYLYVTTWSLGSDLKLLFRTLPIVLRGSRSVT